jgi:fructokinase
MHTARRSGRDSRRCASPQDSTLPTGTVSVTLSPAGVPDYTIHEPAAWDRLAATPEALAAMETAAAVCFGSLAQRGSEARQAIQRLVAATPRAAWRIFDVNLRQCYYDRAVVEASLALANVLKLNEDEVPLVTDLIGVTGDLERRMAQLAARFQLRVVAVTRGDAGSLLLSDRRWSRKSACAVDVQDSVGAGDAFTAVLRAASHMAFLVISRLVPQRRHRDDASTCLRTWFNRLANSC